MNDASHDLIIRILTQYMGHSAALVAYADIQRLKEAIASQAVTTDAEITAAQRDAIVTRAAVAAKRELTFQEKALAEARKAWAALPPPRVFGDVEGADIPEATTEINQLTQAEEAQSAAAVVGAQKAAEYDANIRRLTAETTALEAVLRGETAATEAQAAAAGEAAAATAGDTAAKEAHAAATSEDTAATAANTGAMDAQMLLGRKLVSLFDELSRGQRGAMVSTMGSLVKTMGLGLGGMIAMIGAFATANALYEYFRRADKAAEKLNEKVADLASRVWADLIDAEDSATEHARQYYLELVNTYNEARKIEDPLSSQLKIIEAQAEAQRKLIALQEQTALASLRAQHLPPDEERLREAALRQQFGDVSGVLKLAEERSRLQAQRDRMAEDLAAEDNLFFGAMQTANRTEAAQSRKKLLEEQQSSALSLLKEAIKGPNLALGLTPEQFATIGPDELIKRYQARLAEALFTAQAEFEKAVRAPAPPTPGGPAEHAVAVAHAGNRLRALEDQIKSIRDAQAAYDAATRQVNQQETVVKKLSISQENARRAYNQNESEIKNLTRQTRDAAADLKINEETFRRELVSPAATGAEKAAGQIAGQISAGAPVTAQQRAFLTQWASQIAGHQAELHEATAMAEGGMKNIGVFMNQVARLAAVLARLDVNQLHQLEAKVAEIEAQINTANSLH